MALAASPDATLAKSLATWGAEYSVKEHCNYESQKWCMLPRHGTWNIMTFTKPKTVAQLVSGDTTVTGPPKAVGPGTHILQLAGTTPCALNSALRVEHGTAG